MLFSESAATRNFIDKGVQSGTHTTRKLEKHQKSQRHIHAVYKYTHFTRTE